MHCNQSAIYSLLFGLPFTSECTLLSSHKDRKFMKKHVQQYLENEMGFTLCFHERDFYPGDSIPANIETAIKHSRRMIMIISRYQK